MCGEGYSPGTGGSRRFAGGRRVRYHTQWLLGNIAQDTGWREVATIASVNLSDSVCVCYEGAG